MKLFLLLSLYFGLSISGSGQVLSTYVITKAIIGSDDLTKKYVEDRRVIEMSVCDKKLCFSIRSLVTGAYSADGPIVTVISVIKKPETKDDYATTEEKYICKLKIGNLKDALDFNVTLLQIAKPNFTAFECTITSALDNKFFFSGYMK